MPRVESRQPCSVISRVGYTGCDLKVTILTSKFKNLVSGFHRFFTNSLQFSTDFGLEAGITRGVACRGVAEVPAPIELPDDTAFLRTRPAAVGLAAPRIDKGSVAGEIWGASTWLAS